MAPMIFIFSIAMGADYLFYVKSIATYAPAFLAYNNSVLARVGQQTHRSGINVFFFHFATDYAIALFDKCCPKNMKCTRQYKKI